jgi:hypothetical protein
MKMYAMSVIALLAIAGVGVANAGPPRRAVVEPIAATESRAVEICFPSADWSTGTVSAEDRPCDVLSRPEEDGSGRLVLGTLGADAATCRIPNVYEERGRFTVVCHRLPNR